jgi:hypothetical protein
MGPSDQSGIIVYSASHSTSDRTDTIETLRHALVLVALLSHPACARTLEVGPDQGYRTLAAAIAAAGAGDRVLLAAGHYAECAVLAQDGLILEGAGAATVIEGVACQSKAALVVTGADITVSRLTLAGIRVPNGNGAGIRAEGRNLTVDRVRFEDNEEGILSGPSPLSTITVRDSEFLRNGACAPDCAHAIYAGRIRLLRVERSRFFETRVAHHIKSRAASTEVIDCDLQDGAAGSSSYQIELPNGGALLAGGNRIEKGPLSSNPHTAISLGAEGVSQPPGPILIERNSLAVDGPYQTVFVRNLTPTPAGVSDGFGGARQRAIERCQRLFGHVPIASPHFAKPTVALR